MSCGYTRKAAADGPARQWLGRF